MSERRPGDEAGGASLLALYDAALPEVYGYLLARCGGAVAVAQDLTAETFLAAVEAVRRAPERRLGVAWLIGVARHKLVDHWRREAREERRSHALVDPAGATEDPWEARLDALEAHAALHRLAPHHRAALTLRYVDDLPVPEVAAVLERSVHATEALLVRARAAFRRACGPQEDDRG